jgi:chemotaxis protein CheX
MDASVPNDGQLRLPAVMDLNAAGPLVEALLDLRGQDVTLDASGVERLGAQCLQVLLSAQTTWAHDGRRLVMDQPSAEFTAVVTLLGAATALADAGPALDVLPSLELNA